MRQRWPLGNLHSDLCQCCRQYQAIMRCSKILYYRFLVPVFFSFFHRQGLYVFNSHLINTHVLECINPDNNAKSVMYSIAFNFPIDLIDLVLCSSWKKRSLVHFLLWWPLGRADEWQALLDWRPPQAWSLTEVFFFVLDFYNKAPPITQMMVGLLA